MVQNLESVKFERFYNKNELLQTKEINGKYFIKPNNKEVNRTGGYYLFKEDECIEIGNDVYITDIFRTKMTIQDVISFMKQTELRFIPLNWIISTDGKIKMLQVIDGYDYVEKAICKRNKTDGKKIYKQFLIDENYIDNYYGGDEGFTLEEEQRIANYVFKNCKDIFKDYSEEFKNIIISTLESEFIYSSYKNNVTIYKYENLICVKSNISEEIDIYAIYDNNGEYNDFFHIYYPGIDDSIPTQWTYELYKMIREYGTNITEED